MAGDLAKAMEEQFAPEANAKVEAGVPYQRGGRLRRMAMYTFPMTVRVANKAAMDDALQVLEAIADPTSEVFTSFLTAVNEKLEAKGLPVLAPEQLVAAAPRKATITVVEPPPEDDGLSTGAIVGIVIGSIAGVGLIGFLFLFIRSRRSTKVDGSA